MVEAKAHPCAEGLTPLCFRAYPAWARQAFAYKLLHIMLPKQLTKNLPRGLNLALVPPGVVLPPGAVVPPGVVFPPGWTPGDPAPPGVVIPPGTVFPSAWSPGDPAPPGVVIPPGTIFPPGWSPGDPAPSGVQLPPSVSPVPPGSGITPPLYVAPWEPGPVNTSIPKTSRVWEFQTRIPTGDNYIQWASSGINPNWENVNQYPNENDYNYNYTDVENYKDLFNFDPLSVPAAAAIDRVSLYVRACSPSGNPVEIYPIITIGGVDYSIYSETWSSSDFSEKEFIWYQDPTTNQGWTVTGANNIACMGYKLGYCPPYEARVSRVYLKVDYVI